MTAIEFQVYYKIKYNHNHNLVPLQDKPDLDPHILQAALTRLKFQVDKNFHSYPPAKKTGENVLEKRREKVSEAFLKAWRAYAEYAFGHDELLPVSNSSRDWIGITLLSPSPNTCSRLTAYHQAWDSLS